MIKEATDAKGFWKVNLVGDDGKVPGMSIVCEWSWRHEVVCINVNEQWYEEWISGK